MRPQNNFLFAVLMLLAAMQIQIFLALYPESVPLYLYLLYNISLGNILGGISLFLGVWGLYHVWNMRKWAWMVLPLYLFITHLLKAIVAYGVELPRMILHNPFYWSEFFILLGYGLVANNGGLTSEEKLTLIIPFSCMMFLSSLAETALIFG